jgi:hypothetical protein
VGTTTTLKTQQKDGAVGILKLLKNLARTFTKIVCSLYDLLTDTPHSSGEHLTNSLQSV